MVKTLGFMRISSYSRSRSYADRRVWEEENLSEEPPHSEERDSFHEEVTNGEEEEVPCCVVLKFSAQGLQKVVRQHHDRHLKPIACPSCCGRRFFNKKWLRLARLPSKWQ